MTRTIERGTGRPLRGGYKDADGCKVPSVTTITGRYKDSGALIGWAYGQGKKGVPLYEARDKAGDIGSCVHDMVEADLHGEDAEEVLRQATPYTCDGPDETFVGSVRKGYAAYQAWWATTNMRVVATEVPLVHPTLGFAGTLDAIAETHDGRLVVLDWKTSKGVYLGMYAQVCAYAELWGACRKEPIFAAHIIRYSKTGAGFHHHHYPDLRPGWVYFTHLLAAYKAESAAKEML